jgi:hypothetical protein
MMICPSICPDLEETSEGHNTDARVKSPSAQEAAQSRCHTSETLVAQKVNYWRRLRMIAQLVVAIFVAIFSLIPRIVVEPEDEGSGLALYGSLVTPVF